MSFLGIGGLILVALALILLASHSVKTPVATPYWELGVAAVLVAKLYRGPARERPGAVALCAGIFLLSSEARRIPSALTAVGLACLGAYLIYSEFVGRSRAAATAERRKESQSIVIVTCLLITLALGLCFVVS